jgi:hypothetical protein
MSGQGKQVGFLKGSASVLGPVGKWVAVGGLANAYVAANDKSSNEDSKKNGIAFGFLGVSARTEATILALAGTGLTVYSLIAEAL